MIDPEAASRFYQGHDSAHGFDHVLRVWRLAQRICQAEARRAALPTASGTVAAAPDIVADPAILQAAVLLHDVARDEEMRTGACHALAGAARAREILRGHPPQRVEMVAQAIAQHRFRGASGPSGPEAMILFDADKLDAIGAIGVARAYAIAGATGQRLWAEVPREVADRAPVAGRADLADDEHTPVHEFLFKLIRLKEQLYTLTGRQMATDRHRVMVAFFEELEQEVQGRR